MFTKKFSHVKTLKAMRFLKKPACRSSIFRTFVNKQTLELHNKELFIFHSDCTRSAKKSLRNNLEEQQMQRD